MLAGRIRERLRGDRGYRAIEPIKGIGPTMGAILPTRNADGQP